MRRVTAIIGGLSVAFIVYLIVWFFARNMVEGLGTAAEVGGHPLVVLSHWRRAPLRIVLRSRVATSGQITMVDPLLERTAAAV